MPRSSYYKRADKDLPAVSRQEVPAVLKITLELTEAQAFQIWAVSHMFEGGDMFPTGQTLSGRERHGYRVIDFFPKELTNQWKLDIKDGSRTIDGAEKAVKST